LKELDVIQPNYHLVTADVTSLYTSIPHKDGIKACRQTLNNRPHNTPPTNIIINLINFILTKNNFTFDKKNYLQVQGTAMGTKMAPSYANIFMAELEEEFLSTQIHKPLFYKRYIDDIFFIWDANESTLFTFLDNLNKAHPTIKITYEISQTEVNFLDLTIYKHDGILQTKLYTKPTDKHQYLEHSSCHPIHNKNSIPYSQALRLIRINSEPKYLEDSLNNLSHNLQARGYPRTLINKSFTQARLQNRNQLLSQDNSRNTNTDKIPCTLTYNPSITRISTPIHSYWPILTSKTPSPFHSCKPIIAYRRPKNLRDHLVRASLNQNRQETEGKSSSCGTACSTCPHMTTTTEFTSNITSIKYKIQHNITCKTENLIYLIQCKRCPAQYVGETKNSINYRLTRHRSSHKTKRDEPVANHFNETPHTFKDLTIMGIEVIRNKKQETRKIRESYWISKLKTQTSPGLNIRE
jgi:hypothetical protein